MRVQLKLRLYYGKQMYDSKGNVVTRNECVSIQYDTLEYMNFMKHLNANGVSSVKVEKAYNLDETTDKESVQSLNRYKEIEDVSEYENDIKKYLEVPEKELTPEQKRIKDLEEKLESLLQNQQEPKESKSGLSVGRKKTTESPEPKEEQK
ncbi:hypothetical protein [Chryseobacterium sp. ON_d1]|uniref:hypothetical protein n=1 Tax=Chryseobacterium sp. ON_d1 TaxID=2583211 RepID=UPI00115AB273|nr:hypothetical protein [Chryseobacterium sp. ON_d1]GEJ46019.1 hypothetical protein CRS_26270 [Chryseobacterium sp. ON_d1]